MINKLRCCFLFHHTPPLHFGGVPLLLLSDDTSKMCLATLDQVANAELPVVTHSFSLLVDWFRNRVLPLPKQVIDLEIAQKLLVGRPKSDFDVERPWDMPSMLQRFVHRRYDPKRVRAALATHLAKLPISDFGNLRWMTAIAAGLPLLWHELLVALEEKGELRRFLDVELPAYNVMLASQYRGIRLDSARRETLLQSLEEDYVSAHHQLAIGKGLDVERALADPEYLNGYLICPIHHYEESLDVDQVLDARRDSDPICALLHTITDTRRNRSILLRSFGSDVEHCYPAFDTMGTVTGRILAVDPQLQHLSKKYRDIIKANPGFKLRYIDYAQFEPNIMAHISKDAQLLALCNAGDIYNRMGVEICGDTKHRKIIKLMFLAYSYGKQLSTLPDFLMGILESRTEAEAMINSRFVPLFAGIEKWKTTVELELVKSGRIGTMLGNHRNRVKNGNLEPKEQRWAVSQVVQGTGSLILKKLINRLGVEAPDIEVLLPMHDALLVEVPEGCALEATETLLECSRKSFKETCPLVSPSVNEIEFFA